ncbi:GntR family transcriptional regulator [Variovorax sp. E3]|uniref:GntR family transcriptional regulator n=1 Tax=Variovorax sp. E3 TaxID=1914993 RepID=UPI0018DBDA1C|nr:GntR family transcriptional regulator [Variovorax sp. E3]
MNDDVLSISRESSSLRSQVSDRLRQAILSGRFPPGAKLVERELCESLDISRTLLREALQHLQAEGLIQIVPHRGPSVASLSAQEARDIYRVRESLEALAGEGFARHATAQQMQRLRETLDALEAIGQPVSTEKLLEAKNRFYSILLEGCGNSIVGQMLTQLNNRVTLLRRRSLSQPGRLPQTLAELREIVDALEARDTRRARSLCAAHVRKAAQVAAASFVQASNAAK